MENLCEFITRDNKVFKCVNCGLTIEAYEIQMDTPIFVCSKKKIIEGQNLCTQEQIEERHRICENCEFFQDTTCTKCGCPLNRRRVFSNKLSKKDESCPIGKWVKID